MRVTNANRVGQAASMGAARRTNASGGGFATQETGKTVQAASPRAAQAIRGVEALLAVQGMGDALSGRGRAARNGHSMLDILEDIRADLLAGGIPGDKLERLVRLLSEQSLETGDAGLDGVLAEIDLRARVELAKLGHPDA